jgi:hypothetical protein
MVLRLSLVVVAVLAVGWLAMPFLMPRDDSVSTKLLIPEGDRDNLEGAGVEEQGGGFAADRVKGSDARPIDFDGKRAMGYLEAICDIGPRMSGTPGMAKQQELLRKHFEGLGAKVEAQTFTAQQKSQDRAVYMTNLIVSYHPERKRRVIVCSHYDTRPIADQEPDPRKWRERFVSANDGGSGVAFLMELAHHLKELPLKVGVDFVFFDGEEYIFEPDRDKYFFGSEHFAQAWKKSKNRPDYLAAVLLDMIAGQRARFPVEGYSWARAQPLCVDIWRIARELKSAHFVERIGQRVLDDHLALQNVGIPAIDIIDFDYPHWHRLSDVPANCDADAMTDVARVLSVWMQRMK